MSGALRIVALLAELAWRWLVLRESSIVANPEWMRRLLLYTTGEVDDPPTGYEQLPQEMRSQIVMARERARVHRSLGNVRSN